MDLIDLNRLRVFYLICILGNMKDVSDKYGYSRPTLSKDVAYLEKFFGFNLFVRREDNGYVRVGKLTREGEILLDECRKIFNDFDKIQNFKTRNFTGEADVLTIMMTSGLSQYWFKSHLIDFLKLKNGITPRVVGHNANLNFERDLIDVYIGQYLDSHKDLIQKEIFTIDFGLFAHKDENIQQIKDLENKKIIFNSKFEIDNLVSFLSFTPKQDNLIQINCTETIVELLETGFGVAVLPANTSVNTMTNKKRVLEKKVRFSEKIYYCIQKKNQNFQKYFALLDFIVSKK